MKPRIWLIIAAALLLVAPTAFAGVPGNIESGFFNEILRRFQSAASGWQSVITDAATWLFWCLATISLTWTFGIMALRKAEIGEFAAELVKFIVFTGLWFFLLTNGPEFSMAIMHGLAMLGAQAGGLPTSDFSPSGLVDVGFDVFSTVIDQSSMWPNKIQLSLLGGLLALAILVMLCLIGINMLLLLASAWFLAYAGIFVLGFGGARWTSDMAQNYYRTALGLGLQIMAMVLLVSIGRTFINEYYALLRADIGATSLKSMAALFMACVVLFALTAKIPPMLGGIITGASAGSGIGGAVGFGTIAAAAGMIGGAIATGGSSLIASGAAVAGGAQALTAAFQKASAGTASAQAGADTSPGGNSGSGGSESGNGGGGGTWSGSGSTPLAAAAGFGGGGALASVSKAVRVAGRAGKILVENAAKNVGTAFQERVGQTPGGKLAASIRAQPTFENNNLEEGQEEG
jgi:P-type conjugative transfer protein TrbL